MITWHCFDFVSSSNGEQKKRTIGFQTGVFYTDYGSGKSASGDDGSEESACEIYSSGEYAGEIGESGESADEFDGFEGSDCGDVAGDSGDSNNWSGDGDEDSGDSSVGLICSGDSDARGDESSDCGDDGNKGSRDFDGGWFCFGKFVSRFM